MRIIKELNGTLKVFCTTSDTLPTGAVQAYDNETGFVNAIVQEGDAAYNYTTKKTYMFNGTSWVEQ